MSSTLLPADYSHPFAVGGGLILVPVVNYSRIRQKFQCCQSVPVLMVNIDRIVPLGDIIGADIIVDDEKFVIQSFT